MEQVSMGNHPAPPEGCPDVIKSLMLSCWTPLPRDRVDFTEIVNTLSKDNLKVSLTHSNPCYGMANCQEPTKSTEFPDVKSNEPIFGVKRKTSLNVSAEKDEKPKSWPKLSNFSQFSTSSDASHTHKESICEESDDTISIPSMKPEVEYTIVIPED